MKKEWRRRLSGILVFSMLFGTFGGGGVMTRAEEADYVLSDTIEDGITITDEGSAVSLEEGIISDEEGLILEDEDVLSDNGVVLIEEEKEDEDAICADGDADNVFDVRESYWPEIVSGDRARKLYRTLSDNGSSLIHYTEDKIFYINVDPSVGATTDELDACDVCIQFFNTEESAVPKTTDPQLIQTAKIWRNGEELSVTNYTNTVPFDVEPVDRYISLTFVFYDTVMWRPDPGYMEAEGEEVLAFVKHGQKLRTALPAYPSVTKDGQVIVGFSREVAGDAIETITLDSIISEDMMLEPIWGNPAPTHTHRYHSSVSGNVPGKVEWNWKGDDNSGYTTEVTLYCTKEDCPAEDRAKKTISANVSVKEETVSCDRIGRTIWTARAEYKGNEYIDIRESEKQVPATGHKWDEIFEWTGVTSENAAAKLKATCKNCGIEWTKDASVKVEFRDEKRVIYSAVCTNPDGKERTSKITYDLKMGTWKYGVGESAAPEKEQEAWNLFYNREDGITIPTGNVNLTDKEGNLGANSGKSNKFYKVEQADDGLKVTLKVTSAKDRKSAAAADNSIIILPVYDEEGNEIGQFEHSLNVSYKKPSLKLSVTSATIKNGVSTQLKTTVLEKMSTGAYEPLDLSDADITGGAEKGDNYTLGEVFINTSSKGKVTIGVKDADWSDTVNLKFNVKSSTKDVITATLNGAPYKKITFNKNATTETGFEEFEVHIQLNGSEENLDDITVTKPIKKSGLVVEGIGEDGKLTGSSIKFAYPDGGASTLVKGNYTYALKCGKTTYNLVVAVSNANIDKSVTLKQQTTMNLTTGQKLILIPNLKAISGSIDSDVVIGDSKFEAEYAEDLNQIQVNIAENAGVGKGKVDTSITLTVGGVKITLPLKFKVVTSKPIVKVDRVVLPKNKLTVSGCIAAANVKSTYKLGGKVMGIRPLSITPVSKGKSTITKVEGEDNVYKDSKTGAILKVNKDNTITIYGPITGGGNITVELKFGGDITVKKALSIKVDKKR